MLWSFAERGVEVPGAGRTGTTILANRKEERWHRSDMEEPVMFDRITFDPEIMGGRACIRGMRIPVSVIVGQIAHGATFEEILEDYPDLDQEDIQQAIEYAAWLTQEEVHTV